MIKNFNLFKESVDNISEIHRICKKYSIENYTINDDLSIDVDGDVDLSNSNIMKIPLNFREVSGTFNISKNLQITSLKGSPKIVGSFYCWECNLESLEFGPEIVNGSYNVFKNRLTSLKGGPKEVYNFHCNKNLLTSLEFAPKKVINEFDCSYNQLTSLEHSPEYSKSFYCKDNKITNFRGLGKVEDYFNCNDNPVYEIWKLFRDEEWLDYFDGIIIDDDGVPSIFINRLNDFLLNMGKKSVKDVPGYVSLIDHLFD